MTETAPLTGYTGRPGCPCGGWGVHVCPVPVPQAAGVDLDALAAELAQVRETTRRINRLAAANSAGRDDTQDTRDNPRAAGAASDRGAQPPGQRATPAALVRLRAAMIAGGWTADSRPVFDADDERLAREERADYSD